MCSVWAIDFHTNTSPDNRSKEKLKKAKIFLSILNYILFLFCRTLNPIAFFANFLRRNLNKRIHNQNERIPSARLIKQHWKQPVSWEQNLSRNKTINTQLNKDKDQKKKRNLKRKSKSSESFSTPYKRRKCDNIHESLPLKMTYKSKTDERSE